ncbi:MAG: hypothetical protein Q4B28_01150 [bacterium]|nr:hypothetical protein [bacterium]
MAPNGQITANPSILTHQDVTLTLTTNEDIVTPDGWVKGANARTFTKTVATNQELVVSLVDVAGNSAEARFTVSNIDKSPVTGEITGNPTAWTNQKVTLTLTTNKVLAEVPAGWQAVAGESKKYTKILTANEG